MKKSFKTLGPGLFFKIESLQYFLSNFVFLNGHDYVEFEKIS